MTHRAASSLQAHSSTCHSGLKAQKYMDLVAQEEAEARRREQNAMHMMHMMHTRLAFSSLQGSGDEEKESREARPQVLKPTRRGFLLA